jgi:hypothetical protein
MSVEQLKSKCIKIWILTDPFHYFENHVKAIRIFQIFTNSEYFNELPKKILLHSKYKWEEARGEKETYKSL